MAAGAAHARIAYTLGRLDSATGKFIAIMKKFFLAIIILTALAALAAVIAAYSIDASCLAEGPDVAAEISAIESAHKLQNDGENITFADSWRGERGTIHQMHLGGAPLTLGYSMARLSEEENQHLEDELLGLVDRALPSKAIFWLIQKYVTYRNCHLEDYVKKAQVMEIAGAGAGYQNRHPEMGPPFHRVLNYHAAHDISHYVMDSPLMACTAFAAWGEATKDKHLLIGRTFDFEAGKAFDEDKLVMEVAPETGYRFMAVGWPGLLGVVTGINEKLLYVSLNGANSADSRAIGTPVSLLIRRVMEEAESIEEAYEIIKKAEVFVSDIFLVADGKNSRVAIIEKTPARCAITYPPAGASTLVSANHFLSGDLKDDPKNIAYTENGTSLLRQARMEELVKRGSGQIDPLLAAEILRDRRGLNDLDIGSGNRTAINAIIATHSVITDVTRGIMWVSSYPHQLGPYMPFSLDNFKELPPVNTIPADPFLENGYKEHLASLALIKDAEAALKEKNMAGARRALDELKKLNPNYYMRFKLESAFYTQSGDSEKAAFYAAEAEKLQPAYKD